MATFFQNEQLSQVLTVTGTATMSAGQFLTLYTVPTGYYGILKFAYCGATNGAGYPAQVSNTRITVHHPSVTGINRLDPDYVNDLKPSLATYPTVKALYNGIVTRDVKDLLDNFDNGVVDHVFCPKDFYLESGHIITLYNFFNSTPNKWEIIIHLYKKP